MLQFSCKYIQLYTTFPSMWPPSVFTKLKWKSGCIREVTTDCSATLMSSGFSSVCCVLRRVVSHGCTMYDNISAICRHFSLRERRRILKMTELGSSQLTSGVEALAACCTVCSVHREARGDQNCRLPDLAVTRSSLQKCSS